MGIDRRKQYLPLVFNPLMSLKVVFGVITQGVVKGENNRELEVFCTSRNIQLLTYQS